MSNQLTTDEQQLLIVCEKRIEAGLHTFYEVGMALAMIRDRKLYKRTHVTFEDYCKDRWHFAVRQAYRAIKASEIYQNIVHIGFVSTNERQLRALEKIPPENQAEVWNQAVEAAGGIEKVTAAQVAIAAKKFLKVPMRRQIAKISLRICRVCRYHFSDEHHLKSQSSGGRHFGKIPLCPNHHRYATILQQMIENENSRQEIEDFAAKNFDQGFNAKLLRTLLDHSFQISTTLVKSFDVFSEAFSTIEELK